MKKRLFIFFTLLIAIQPLVTIYGTLKAEAYNFPNDYRTGFFTGNATYKFSGFPVPPWFDSVVPGGILYNGAGGKTCWWQGCSGPFIDRINSLRNHPNVHYRRGAGFVIRTMLRQPFGTSEWVDDATFNQWAQWIRLYDQQGRINWNAYAATPAGQPNSAWAPHYNDVIFFQQRCSGPFAEPTCNVHPEIHFYLPNGEVYRMMNECANPTGNIPGLLPPWTNGSGGCAISGAPDFVAPGQPINATINFVNTGSTIWFNFNDRPGTHHGIASRGPGGWPPDVGTWGTNRGTLIWSTGPGQTGTFVVNAVAPSTPGVYEFNWGMVHESFEHFGPHCGKPITVVKQNFPFLSSSGGDIHAGGGVGVNCTPAGAGNVRGTAEAGVGSKAQYIVSANGSIDAFGSGDQVRDPSGSGLSLTFGSNGSTTGRYGTICRPDLVSIINSEYPSNSRIKLLNPAEYAGIMSAAPTTGSTWDVARIPNIPGGVHINGANLTSGKPWTLYVDGDVYIDSDITFANGNFGNLPSFGLVARGNIHIGPNVRRLDGFFFAGGMILTCSAPGVTVDDDRCEQNQLNVRGMLMANRFMFQRSYFNPDNNSDVLQQPAETVSFLGQLFLKTPPGFSDSFSATPTGRQFSGERAPRF